MDLSIEEVIKRLLLLGLPLVPLGCSDGGHMSGLPDSAVVEIDGGGGGSAGTGGMGGGTGGGLAGTGGNGGGGTGGDGLAGTGGDATAGTTGEGGTGGIWVGPPRCPPPETTDQIVTVMGSEANVAAYGICLNTGDCSALCAGYGHVLAGGTSTAVDKCERVDPPLPADAGTDGGDARDSGLDSRGADAHADATGAPSIKLHVVTTTYQVCGRRPAGLASGRAPSFGSEVGQWLAGAATLEAASVPAFRRLARELAAHGAPERLVEAARGAAREEARHYALMRRLARAHGVEPRRPRVRALPVRSLGALARENAREGCVRETFGAMIAAHQAAHAADAVTRDAMAAIAVDESRHAQLAWEVDAWARATLPRDEARAVARARRDAATKLLRDLGRGEVPAGVAQTLGLPSAAAAQAHARRAHAALWSA